MFVSIKTITDLEEALRLILPPEKLENIQTIFIKPNLGYSAPYPRTSSLESLKQIISYLKRSKSNLEIQVGEGSASKTSSRENAENLGVIQLIQSEQAQFLDLDSQNFKVIEGIGVPEVIIKADLRISVPVVKIDSNSELLLSCAVKNYLGIPPRSLHSEKEGHLRDSFHRDLHKSVAEVYRKIQCVAPFEIHVVDGTMILKGGLGKRGLGKETHWGKGFVGTDAVELDFVLCEKFGLPVPRYLHYLHST